MAFVTEGVTVDQLAEKIFQQADEIKRLRAALEVCVDWFTPPNDSKPFPISVVIKALEQKIG